MVAVIPAWNEAVALRTVLEELARLPTGTLYRVIVADGGSSDGTPEVARAGGADVVAQQRRGYGAACWEGFARARQLGADVVVFLDGDGSDPPGALPALLAPVLLGEVDLALGARRASRGSAGMLPWHARLGNTLVCALLRWRTSRRVTDLPSMKAARVATLEALELREMGYGWTTEMIARSLARGLRISELPVSVRPRLGGTSKVSGNLIASVRAAYALVRVAIQATR